MNIYKNTHNLLENSLKIGSAIFFIVGASLIIPRIADAALSLNNPNISEYSNPVTSKTLSKEKEQNSSGYQPPDFGRPSSAYGSGTR
ncbi:MAG: hypothetical protein SWZ49_26110 [Cyanobacteriota bacterium]|nr:hypothetical protein [Cyanobacteriota bacterium]